MISQDNLREVLSYFGERDYPTLRLVCRDWNEFVMAHVCEGKITDLVMRELFLSAAILIARPRKQRLGNPLHPNKVLIAACFVGHLGMVRKILRTFTRYEIRAGACIPLLLSHADITKQIHRDKLLILVELMKFERDDPRLTIEFAAQYNCVEMAQLIAERYGNDVKKYGNLHIALMYAANHQNVPMAQIICDLPHYKQPDWNVVDDIIEISPIVALICIREKIPLAIAHKLYNRLQGEEYGEIKAALKPLADDHEMEQRRLKELKALRTRMREKVKKYIVEDIAAKYPDVEHKVMTGWCIDADIDRVNFTRPWVYKYKVSRNGDMMIFVIDRVINSESEDEPGVGRGVQVCDGDCVIL